MPEVCTTRIRDEWVDEQLEKYGTITRIAEKMDVDLSTASRWMSGRHEASNRCIGTVLIKFGVDFDTAFVATVEEARQRRARIIKRPTGTAAA